MPLLKFPFVPLRSRRVRQLDELSDHLRRDIGLPRPPQAPGLDLSVLFLGKN